LTPWNPYALVEQVSGLVLAAGDMLVAEFMRPGGPRGAGETAAIDAEIEAMLRPALLALQPARYAGEETGQGGDLASNLCWLVDPHDGTSAFLDGHRGTSVSVALLRDGVPVLGVVYAPMPPDRGPDLIAWAEGMSGLRRNGVLIEPTRRDAGLSAGDIVFLNHRSAARPVAAGSLVAPARFVALPSIAYRLARVAAGDGVAAVSFNAPVGHDYAAGHALLIGAGCVLLDQAGRLVTYGTDARSAVEACFGGESQAAAELARRGSPRAVPETAPRPSLALAWPRPAGSVALDRAIGCLFGQVIGDSLGSLVEFRDARSIAESYPDGVRDLADGGTWDTIAGQPTDDSELALALARTLAAADTFDGEAIAAAYGAWVASGPFDIGTTTSRALGAAAGADAGKATAARRAADAASQANGSLMRIAPAGIWAGSAAEAAEIAARDSALSHPHPVCRAACAAFAAAVWTGIAGGSRGDMLAAARHAAIGTAAIADALGMAAAGAFPSDYQRQQGWVVTAFQNAFAHLAHGDAPEAALIATVGRGGDTDTNAAIAGALLGAAHGRDAFPARWRLPVLACRPHAALGDPQPRPPPYWPDDLPALAEALLLRRLRRMDADS
jgi:ADP-ribosylglycohydrolase/fructose-1,6-bisphosphatase/inositol monophosphatase family enzyme